MSGKEAKVVPKMQLLQMPDDCLVSVLRFLSYDEISQKRLVCRKFNSLCGHMLNAGLKRADEQKNREWKRIRTMVPRRESERRVHPLSRHLEILSSLDTRVALLNMTYQRYIESKSCPFIPGKVLDEIFNVLGKIASSQSLQRSHEVLKELRDISSMAIEHFDEFVVPRLKEKEAVSAHCSPGYSAELFGQQSLSLDCVAHHALMRQNGLTTAETPPKCNAPGCRASTTPASSRSRGDDALDFFQRQNRFSEELKSLNTRVQDLEQQKNAAKAMPPPGPQPGPSTSPEITALAKQVKELQNRLDELEKRGYDCDSVNKSRKRKLESIADEPGPSGEQDQAPARRTRAKTAKVENKPVVVKAKGGKKPVKLAIKKGGA